MKRCSLRVQEKGEAERDHEYRPRNREYLLPLGWNLRNMLGCDDARSNSRIPSMLHLDMLHLLHCGSMMHIHRMAVEEEQDCSGETSN